MALRAATKNAAAPQAPTAAFHRALCKRRSPQPGRAMSREVQVARG